MAQSSTFSELQRKKFSAHTVSGTTDKVDPADDSNEAEQDEQPVYGIVKTHAPPQAPQVRDPTKEILSGLWRSASRSSSSQNTNHHQSPASALHQHHTGGKKHFQPYFGRIRTQSQGSSSSKPLSKFQLLRNELYGNSVDATGNGNKQPEVYGTVHHRFNPNAGTDKSRLDLVRSILAKEEGMEVNEESKNAFDRIRDKLLNTRNHRVRSSQSTERNLRRKGSKKRRRNVSKLIGHVPFTPSDQYIIYFKSMKNRDLTYLLNTYVLLTILSL